MPLTPEGFIIDPQGVTVQVSVTDLDGNAVDTYLTEDADSPIEGGAIISTPTQFFFTSPDVPQNRPAAQPVVAGGISATTYIVSVKFNGVEIAGVNGSTAYVDARSTSPAPTFVVDLGNGAVELANLISGVPSPNYHSLGIETDFRVGYTRNPDGSPGDGVLGTEMDPVGLIVWSEPAGSGIITVDASTEEDGGASDQIGFFGSSLHRSDVPALPMATVTVDPEAYNTLVTMLEMLGVVTYGEGWPD